MVHNSENRIEIPISNPNFQKTRIFELTKFIYLGLIPDMPNIHSEISPPIQDCQIWENNLDCVNSQTYTTVKIFPLS